jgi:hypothetical protein
MIDSILTSTKKILGIGEDYTAFDEDIITHINSTFSIVHQMGIGPEDGYMITDAEDVWDDIDIHQSQLNLLRTYVFLKVRILFDPPATSYLIEATNKQIQEYEYRLSYNREVAVTMGEEEEVA